MGNGTITMTGAEYDALAGKVAALEAENAKLKGEYEWVASINTALDESNQSAWAENAKLRAELERRAADVSAMARVLSDRAADACNIDRGDNWAMYGQEYIDDVHAMLAAAPSAPATAQGGVYSTDPLACSGCVSGCFRCRSVKVQGDGWIPVSERLPESERTVLAFYLNSHGKGRRVRAEYIAAKTKSADDGWDSDEPADYDEQEDEYFWPADWYEVMDNWDDLTHMVIHEGEVTHWMPLPAAPGAAQSAPKADDPVKQMLLEALNGMLLHIREPESESEFQWPEHFKKQKAAFAAARAAIAAARKGEGE